MFFILSKTLYYLILPYTLIGLTLIAALLVKKSLLKKKLILLTIFLYFFFGNSFLSNTLLQAWEISAIPYDDINKEYAYGVVLTGVLENEQEPKDRPHFQKGADRVFHTFQLYQKGIINKILISGGSGSLLEVDFREADNLYKIFIEMGVPAKDLIIESESDNTAQSALNVSKILAERNATDNFLLITSAFHMRRSIGCFEKQLGTSVSGFPVDYYTDPRLTFDDYVIPSLAGLKRWSRLIHEVTGYVVYDIVGYI